MKKEDIDLDAFEAACVAIESNVGSSRRILQKAGGVSYETIRRWMYLDPSLCARYAQAKAEQVEVHIENTIDDIFTDQHDDYLTDGNGNQVPNALKIARMREKKDFCKWYASKLKAKKYGDITPPPESNNISPVSISLPARKSNKD